MSSRMKTVSVDSVPAGTPANSEAVARHGAKWMVLGALVAAALVLPLGAAAQGHGYRGGYGHGYSGGYGHGNYSGGYYDRGYNRGYNHGYRHGGHWSGGRWIAGAIVAGAVVSLIDQATRPVYYDRPVVYSQPRVVYERYYPAPVVRRRVVETRTVYVDPYETRYVRSDDGYDD